MTCIPVKICIFSLFFLTLYPTTISAQRSLIFEEYFDDNFLMWMTGNTPEYAATVQEGYYNIGYKQNNGVWYFWQSVPVHPDTSFYIESKIIPFLKTKESVYGLIWGVKDVNNYNSFMISSMGMASVGICEKGVFKKIIPWQQAGNYQNNQQHYLGIRQKGGKLHYYLDGKKIFSSSVLPFRGPRLGFMISGKTTAKIDYLRVQQDRHINLIEDAIRGQRRENLGANINSNYAELHPLVAHDGNSLFVTRKGHPENIGYDKKDDAWVAHKQQDGSWSKIKQMAFPINNNNHNHIIAVSPDNNTLLLGNTYYANGHSKGKGISMSHRQEDGSWAVPEDVIIDNFYNQNPIHSMHLSADKKLLIMSIERNDSYGHLDIYVSILQKNGHFSQPKNLGNTINTSYEDGTPFLAADGKTLYFSSAGHGGYGSTDIFVSRRLDDSWRKWSIPQNLGPEINSNEWEGYYSITAAGDKAYLVSNKGKDHIGGEDIYKVIPPKSARPNPVLILKGRVIDAKTKAALHAKILFRQANNKQEISNALSNHSNGEFQAIIPSEKSYDLLAFKGGYFPVNRNVAIGKIDSFTTLKLNIELYPIEEDSDIPLQLSTKNRQGALSEQDIEAIERLLVFMKKYPDMKIQLKGPSAIQLENSSQYIHAKDIAKTRVKTKQIDSLKEVFFEIEALNLREEKQWRRGNFNKNLTDSSLQNGQIFRLNNTFFPADSSRLTTSAQKELTQVIALLQNKPQLTVEIGGHSNGLPDHAYCDKLSTERAKRVADFLYSNGIPDQQVSYKGYGKRNPIASNENQYGRRRNQRVELKIIAVK